MGRKREKIMPLKYFLTILFSLFIISCNRINLHRATETSVDSNEPSVTNSEAVTDFNEPSETDKAVINSDCGYYLDHSDTPSGKLIKGQSVIILNYYYVKERTDNFDIYVEVETLDKTIKGSVLETYLTYPNSHSLWFKNILLTRSYYYSESAEDIYRKGYLSLIDEGESKEDSIIIMKRFFSENRLLISERHLVIGCGGYGTLEIYRILSIEQKKENTYLLNLIDDNKKGFELVLLVDDDSITITQIVNKNELDLYAIALNIKYIVYNREKSEKVETDILAWCNEQIEKLEKINP